MAASDNVEIFPLPPFAEVLEISVALGDQSAVAVLDTGAVENSIDAKFLGLLPHDGTADQEQLEWSRRRVRLGQSTIVFDGSFRHVDLHRIRNVVGTDIAVLLGAPFFRAHVVQVDFDAHAISIQPSSVDNMEINNSESVEVFFLKNLAPAVKGHVAGFAEYFILDTGYTGTAMLRPKVFDHLEKVKKISLQSTELLATVRENEPARRGKLSSISLGSRGMENVSVVRSPVEASLIGAAFIMRHKTTFDLGRKRVFVGERSSYKSYVGGRAAGVVFMRREGETLIMAVDEASAADDAGLKQGDTLLEVAGKSVEAKSLSQIRWLVRRAMHTSGHVNMKIARHGAESPWTVSIGK